MDICECGNESGFDINTPTGNYFGYQKPIKRPLWPKIDMWSGSTRVSIINDICHTHRKLFCYQKQIKGQNWLKFSMWFARNWVNVLSM